MNATAENPVNLNLVLDVPVSLTIELGGCQLPMREVLQLNIGSVVQLDKAADAPVELSINGKLIARGEVVIIEDRYGVKITEVIGTTSPALKMAVIQFSPRSRPRPSSSTTRR